MAIDTGWKTESVSFSKKLLPAENLEAKISLLNEHVEALNENSTEFFNLFNNIIITEEQKGQMIEEMKELAGKLQQQHYMYNEALGNQNKFVVEQLEARIEENKTQKLSATYYVSRD